MPDGLDVRGISIPESDLDWRFTGSGGPGGQHANTSNTAAELRLNVRTCDAIPDRIKERILRRLSHRMTNAGELITTGSEHRSQTRNREEARKRMAELLDEGIKPPPKRRKPTRPSRASKRRRVENKRRRGQLKADRGRDWGA
ncbi:alternative ribosome rescue aminoacyl-tRNA hydrolase ArfB [Euzebya tangerina]|uniref:alternative ribosome rescue aminoacyl-tRNA hydrolase ArfB n=1 Tax=Euzebya tangerina TaxID=591198 RepID=UPI000E321779|nr:alternative ribosome rescue aminoacyl-tRNA hydrolase ArfB [Euzebya tangerina]